MHELFARRRENLRRLVQNHGGQKQFLNEVGYSKGWLSQLIGRTPTRDLSEAIAREIERAIGAIPGTLDEVHIESTPTYDEGRENISEVLSRNLRTLMEAQGINQSELARRANMALSSLNRAFNALDNNVSPRLETLAGISRGLGVHPSELLKSDISEVVPAHQESKFSIARQLSRLVEDFLLSSQQDRTELLRLAEEAARRAEDSTRRQR